MTDEVIAALALPKQVNYLHLPVQSGNDEVLRRMNRKYTREQLLEVIKKVKAARPGIALGTDLIVGFPGESAEQFADTLSLYREVDFDISYNAQYSPRSGTLGVKLYPDDVSKEEKRERWDALHVLMEETALRKNQEFLGQTVSVLIDKVEAGFASGSSRELKFVRVASKDEALLGKIVPVRVTGVKAWVLEGEVAA
jgi:tRNA-2-methylthio-N6-dimethylallyladenosine synthase